MFHEVADDPGERNPEALYEQYASVLADVVEARGIEAVSDEAGVEASKLRALLEDERPELTLEEAAAVVATRERAPDAEAVAAEARDALLMGMTTAVLDVEAVESGVGGELEAREIQSKVEGRFPMTLREFALLHQYIESQTP